MLRENNENIFIMENMCIIAIIMQLRKENNRKNGNLSHVRMVIIYWK